MNEQEVEALTRIYEYSRVNKFTKGLAEDQIGAPHYVIKSLQDQYLIYSRTYEGKVYWHPTAKGKQIGGMGTRDQVHNAGQTGICPTCKNLGISLTELLIRKTLDMRGKVGMLGLTQEELHILKEHVKE